MDLRELTDRMNAFVATKGWDQPDSAHPQTPANLAKSLVIEAAEVLELFQWGEHADTRLLEGELADVFLYLLQLADRTGIDLARATLDKLAHNRYRHW